MASHKEARETERNEKRETEFGLKFGHAKWFRSGYSMRSHAIMKDRTLGYDNLLPIENAFRGFEG